MNLTTQRRIAADVLGVGINRIWFDPDRLTEIKEAITKADIRSLIKNLAIQARPGKGISSYRDRKRKAQLRKGRQKGKGSKTGTHKARLGQKKDWINRVRKQRRLLKTLKNKKMLEMSVYKNLYSKVGGGFFRSKRHLQMYMASHNLIREKKK